MTGLFGYLPSILQMNTQIKIPGFNAGNTFTVFANQTGSSYVGGNGSTTINGIVLTNTTGTSRIDTVTYPDSTSRLSYIYYNSALTGMDASGTIYIWYTNQSTASPNVGTAALNVFVGSGVPSVVPTPTVTPGGAPAAGSTAITSTVSYSAPTYVDSSNPGTSPSANPITLYDISYSSAPSANRYGTPKSIPSTHQLTAANSYPFTAMYPNSVYTFQVAARNTLNANYGPFSALSTGTTASLQPITATAPAFSSALFINTAGTLRVSDSASVAGQLLAPSTSSLTTNSFITPVHTAANQGSTSAALATLTAVVGARTGPTLSFGGFGTTPPTATTANNITITPTVADTYSTSSGQACDGFYLQSTNTVAIPTSALTAANTQQSMVVTPSPGSATSLPFYYDTSPATAPSSLSAILTIGSSFQTRQVSGINILYGIPYYNVTTNVSNMGNYFYRSPLLTYTLTPIADVRYETGLGATSISGGAFVNPVVFNVTNLAGITNTIAANTYATSVGLASLVAHNTSGLTTSVSPTPINAIIDAPSYSLLLAEPATIPTLGTTGVRGMRIWSMAPPYSYAGFTNIPDLSTISPTTKYLQSWDITAANYAGELQLVNGQIAANPTGGLGYKNYVGYAYSPTLSNTLDYSGIGTSGYRYATFAWQFPSMSSPVQTMQFVFTNFVGITGPATGDPVTDGTNKIYIYYMFVDSTQPLGFNSNNSSILTSTWIDANTLASGAQAVTSTNFNNTQASTPAATYSVYYAMQTTNTYSGNTLTLRPVFPGIRGTTNVSLLLRVGLPMNSAASFASVSAYYS
jgi:hypothetical protein